MLGHSPFGRPNEVAAMNSDADESAGVKPKWLASTLSACIVAAGAQASGRPQEAEPVALVPNAEVLVELGPNDIALPGLGRARVFVYTSDFSGGVYVRSWSEELELRIRLEDEHGKVFATEDSGPEHGLAVLAPVEPGSRVLVHIISLRADDKGRLRLELVAARETEETRAAAELARDALAEAGRLWSEGDRAGARSVLEEVVGQVVSTPGAELSQPLSLLLDQAATTANKYGLLRASAAAHAVVLSHCERALPADFYVLQVVRVRLAATLAELGDLRRARDLYEQALAVYSRLRSERDESVQLVRQDLAGVLALLGDLPRARELYEQGFTIYSQTLPADHPALQRARENLAALLRIMGDLPRARELHEEALAVALRTRGDDDPDLQLVRQNLAITLADMGDSSRVRELDEKVFEVLSRTLPDDHPALQGARTNLASSLNAAGEVASARKLFEQVLAARSRTLPEDSADLQYAKANLASTLWSTGESERARALEEQVLEVFSRTLPGDHPDLQKARSTLAATLRIEGELARALELQRQVVQVLSQEFPVDHPDLLRERRELAWILAALGEREACSAQALELARGLHEAVQRWLLVLSPREMEMRAAQFRDEVSAVLSLAHGAARFEPDPALEREAVALVEGLRGMSLRSALELRSSRADPERADLSAEVRASSEELVRLARSGAGRDALAAARSRREVAERALLRRAREAGSPTLSLQADVGALSAGVESGTALVGFCRYSCQTLDPDAPGVVRAQQRLCAFVIESGGTFARVELGPLGAIDAAAQRWRDALIGPSAREGRGVGQTSAASQASELEAGAELRRLVFDPLVPALADVGRVILAPDDMLLAVPLDALPDDGTHADASPERLLGDRLRIEVRPTLWELLVPSTATPSLAPGIGEVLLLGGIDYDIEPEALTPEETPALGGGSSRATAMPGAPAVLRGERGSASFSFLEGTAGEVAAITELEHDGLALRLLSGNRASRQALVALAPRARFLHLATHGWFAPESVRSLEDPRALQENPGTLPWLTREQQVRGASPMVLCGLALAGANLPEEAGRGVTGMITAEELSTLDLSGCELAVLSACDTNLGVRRAGQGVASLQKALHMAGARTVITSLWMVPDEATRELMVDFYRRIWVEKKPKAQALWEAKKRLREARDERGRPLFSTRDWAAWVLTGAAE